MGAEAVDGTGCCAGNGGQGCAGMSVRWVSPKKGDGISDRKHYSRIMFNLLVMITRWR